MSRRFRICLAVWAAVLVFSIITGDLNAQDAAAVAVPDTQLPAPTVVTPQHIPDDEWVMEITPARKVTLPPVIGQSVPAVDGNGEQPCGQAGINPLDYSKIYESIPFNRAEWLANPSYRHDSAMEILTGNKRHLTVVRHGSPERVVAPARPAAPQVVVPYGYGIGAGWIRPSIGLNYYRHFPSLNPYRNMFWGAAAYY